MSIVGTPLWVAPEILRRERYGPSCDQFSYAMVLVEMATRERPYKTGDTPFDPRAVMAGARPDVPSDKPYLRLGLALLAACGVGCRRDLRRARIVLNLSRRKLAFLSRGTLCASLGPGPARRARARLTCLWPQTPTAGQWGGEA